MQKASKKLGFKKVLGDYFFFDLEAENASIKTSASTRLRKKSTINTKSESKKAPVEFPNTGTWTSEKV